MSLIIRGEESIMLTEIINDKKFRIFFIVLVVGIMLTVISVPDAISLLKPAKDISQLWVTDPSTLKTGDHVCLDISLISDSPFSKPLKYTASRLRNAKRPDIIIFLISGAMLHRFMPIPLSLPRSLPAIMPQ